MAESGYGVSLLLHSLQSPINVGAVLRMAESFAVAVDIWDEAGLFADPAAFERISDFSCGAVDRGSSRLLDRQPVAGDGVAGRDIATCFSADAVTLEDFRFAPGARIAIGMNMSGCPPHSRRPRRSGSGF